MSTRNHLKRITLRSGFLIAQTLIAFSASLLLANPIVRGDYPDPSIIRDENGYWAVATSSEWGPQFPILHSTDLQNWNLEGSVFAKRPEWATGNFWAPEIFKNGSTYYIYYVGRKKGGPLNIAVATATSPVGPYTDHGPIIGQSDGSIDPDPTLDENNRMYLVWKEDGNSRGLPTPIWAQQLSDDGTTLTGDRKELIRNDVEWEGSLVEGPFVLKHDDYFYLFYAGGGCCGRKCSYGVGVARSKHLLGPYEKNPANPILTDDNNYNCPGHGSVVSDNSGNLHFLYHAYDQRDNVYVGRQPLLSDVTFSKEKWPVINHGNGPGNASPPGQMEFSDDFSSPTLQPGWQWPQDTKPRFRTRIYLGKTGLLLSPDNTQKKKSDMAVLARRTTSGDYTAEATFESVPSYFSIVQPGSGETTSGLCAYGDENNFIGICADRRQISIYKSKESKQQQLASVPVITTGSDQTSSASISVKLQLIAHDGHLFDFNYQLPGQKMQKLGSTVDGDYLPPWDRGIRTALFAHEPMIIKQFQSRVELRKTRD
jgi:beta-xylosidase